MRTITMSPNGRLTLPAEVRQRLGLAGETEFDVESPIVAASPCDRSW